MEEFKTDIDRLHRVFQNPCGRRIGKTVLYCHEVCGDLETSENRDVFCIVPFIEDIHHVVRTLLPILAEHEIKVVVQPRQLQSMMAGNSFIEVEVPDVGRKVIRFISSSQLHRTDGYAADCVEFDR